MKTKSLVAGYVLALALFLFAQRRPVAVQPPSLHAVIDLSKPDAEAHVLQAVAYSNRDSSPGTRLEAPAKVAASLWTANQIPLQRLVAPLVVLDVRNSVVRNPDYQVSVMDIANWERIHGEIALGSVVMALTGTHRQRAGDFGFSADATKFLIEGRNVVGLGTDSPGIDAQSDDVASQQDSSTSGYALSHSAYLLDNVANLDMAPSKGAIVVVAPAKRKSRTDVPVRILALAR